MKVLILFEPDETCVDPKDGALVGRKHYEMVQPSQDAIVMWREYGDAFEGGYRTHIVGNGVFENVTIDNGLAALEELGVL